MSTAAGLWGNASSVHQFGRAARRVLEDARVQVAALVSARPAEVVFTSGGTEANNLALRGCGRSRVLVTAIEHPSVLQAADAAEIIPVDACGIPDLAALEEMLEQGQAPAVVSVMLANNETGVILPVAEAATVARRYGALIHCDAVQAAGRMPLDMGVLGVDMLTLSAHKLGGPKGAGALIAADHVPLQPIVRGGGQERGRRSGTENLPGIAGFGAAARAAAADAESMPAMAALRDGLEELILRDMPQAEIIGREVDRLANTSCLAVPGISAETQVMALDLAGFAVSAGSACSSGKVAASHVLQAMGFGEDIAGCAIRVSLGAGNTPADIERFVAAYREFSDHAGTFAA